MSPPAIGPGFRMDAALRLGFPETLVAACTKVIWEGEMRVQDRETVPFFDAPAP